MYIISKNRNLWTVAGFLISGMGFVAIVLSLVGVQLSILTWIDKPGRLFGFLIRLLMIVSGIVLIFLSQTNLEDEPA
ncbi:MAG: hypothetical protein AAF798_11735 [Bacteroidota bacterium]